mmetsp:Transcript_5139/g.5590  ORF Transcript_5139/g.5590 Transcript_5139/m.5590 type:complete len:242 (+) Transcript_5139:177-902(+)
MNKAVAEGLPVFGEANEQMTNGGTRYVSGNIFFIRLFEGQNQKRRKYFAMYYETVEECSTSVSDRYRVCLNFDFSTREKALQSTKALLGDSYFCPINKKRIINPKWITQTPRENTIKNDSNQCQNDATTNQSFLKLHISRRMSTETYPVNHIEHLSWANRPFIASFYTDGTILERCPVTKTSFRTTKIEYKGWNGKNCVAMVGERGLLTMREGDSVPHWSAFLEYITWDLSPWSLTVLLPN